MNINIIGLIKAAVLNGTPLLYGTSGEILTEKSGNLNLGVEGLMYMGGAFGLCGAFVYGNLAGRGSCRRGLANSTHVDYYTNCIHS